MLFGVTDLTLLISIAMANATMNILGLFQEKYNNIRDPDAVIDWVWSLLSVLLDCSRTCCNFKLVDFEFLFS